MEIVFSGIVYGLNLVVIGSVCDYDQAKEYGFEPHKPQDCFVVTTIVNGQVLTVCGYDRYDALKTLQGYISEEVTIEKPHSAEYWSYKENQN